MILKSQFKSSTLSIEEFITLYGIDKTEVDTYKIKEWTREEIPTIPETQVSVQIQKGNEKLNSKSNLKSALSKFDTALKDSKDQPDIIERIESNVLDLIDDAISTMQYIDSKELKDLMSVVTQIKGSRKPKEDSDSSIKVLVQTYINGVKDDC